MEVSSPFQNMIDWQAHAGNWEIYLWPIKPSKFSLCYSCFSVGLDSVCYLNSNSGKKINYGWCTTLPAYICSLCKCDHSAQNNLACIHERHFQNASGVKVQLLRYLSIRTVTKLLVWFLWSFADVAWLVQKFQGQREVFFFFFWSDFRKMPRLIRN